MMAVWRRRDSQEGYWDRGDSEEDRRDREEGYWDRYFGEDPEDGPFPRVHQECDGAPILMLPTPAHLYTSPRSPPPLPPMAG